MLTQSMLLSNPKIKTNKQWDTDIKFVSENSSADIAFLDKWRDRPTCAAICNCWSGDGKAQRDLAKLMVSLMSVGSAAEADALLVIEASPNGIECVEQMIAGKGGCHVIYDATSTFPAEFLPDDFQYTEVSRCGCNGSLFQYTGDSSHLPPVVRDLFIRSQVAAALNCLYCFAYGHETVSVSPSRLRSAAKIAVSNEFSRALKILSGGRLSVPPIPKTIVPSLGNLLSGTITENDRINTDEALGSSSITYRWRPDRAALPLAKSDGQEDIIVVSPTVFSVIIDDLSDYLSAMEAVARDVKVCHTIWRRAMSYTPFSFSMEKLVFGDDPVIVEQVMDLMANATEISTMLSLIFDDGVDPEDILR